VKCESGIDVVIFLLHLAEIACKSARTAPSRRPFDSRRVE
jgi:hypothetical protein